MRNRMNEHANPRWDRNGLQKGGWGMGRGFKGVGLIGMLAAILAMPAIYGIFLLLDHFLAR